MAKQLKKILPLNKSLALIICALLLSNLSVIAQDRQADNMLLFQRSYGGWAKHFNKQIVNYQATYSPQQIKEIRAQVNAEDATIDNKATTKEIRYLLSVYAKHKTPSYLQAAEKGIEYLLKAQYKNGGWPQYYPGVKDYHSQVTYNDHAMVNVLNLLKDLTGKKPTFEVLNATLVAKASAAIEKGIQCILKTQVVVNNKPTAWAAQYDPSTLKPADARKFEPAGLSSMESVGIIQFLMRIENPSTQVVAAIEHAKAWFQTAAIKGYESKIIPDANQPKGVDRILVPAENNTTWARFYDINTNQPFFCGRDGIKKNMLSQIEVERRVGYAWYGEWPQNLLDKQYPKWKLKNLQ